MPTYKTNGAWGTGIGINLTAAQADGNAYEFRSGLNALIANPPEAINIASIVTQDGLWTVTMTDASTFVVPVEMVTTRDRKAWEPFAVYVPLDLFTVDGVGIFVVLEPHTAGALFNPDLMTGGSPDSPVYRKMFGFSDGGDGLIYDLIIPYQGRLSDLTLPIVIPALRSFKILVTGNSIARLGIPPSTANQTLPLFHNATQIGTVTWLIGEELGTVVFTADEVITVDEYFSIGLPLAADATAAGMSLAIAAERVL